jgi:hypothetical protein
VFNTVEDASGKGYREGSSAEALAPFWLYAIVLSRPFSLAVWRFIQAAH